MSSLWITCSLVCFLLVRYWKITIPLAIVVMAIGQENVKDDRMKFRGYDPQEFTQAGLQQAVRIMVPAYVKDAGGEYPVTIANNAARAFDGQFYVLCTATETVLDGTTNWVLGVKQYPYLFGRNMQIASKSIATEQFQRISDDMGPYTNLTKCKFYTSDAEASAAKDSIEMKWTQVTPRGAERAREIGYTWMNIPQGYNSPDYQSPW
jgi:hypothetical protein